MRLKYNMTYYAKCNCCESMFEEKQIQEHHIHPRFMDNSKGLGIKRNLCEKCHSILHNMIPAIMWKRIPESLKLELIRDVKGFSLNFKRKGDNNGKENDTKSFKK